ncbi:unnamed protein product, partial [Dovyalis caffra]
VIIKKQGLNAKLMTKPKGKESKELAKVYYKLLQRHVELEDMTSGTMNPSELLVRRFCSSLGMRNYAVKAVGEALAKMK